VAPEPPSQVEGELSRRAADGGLSRWQERLLAWRIDRAASSEAGPELRAYPTGDLAQVRRMIVRHRYCTGPEPRDEPPVEVVSRDEFKHLVDLITGTIDPECWRENGGDGGSARLVCDRLVVRTSKANHEQIAALLNGLHAVWRLASGRVGAADDVQRATLPAADRRSRGEQSTTAPSRPEMTREP
jgi:hypothetical protein